MELLWFTIKEDWAILLPIVICSILTVAVAIERFYFYSQNKREVVQFIHHMQRELQRGQLENAQVVSSQLGGIIGEVAEEGIRILSERKGNFSGQFDITANLAARKLEKGLSVLGTIGGIAPFLGLLGTVIRILLTFGELANAGGQSAQVAFGIGSALIATAFGLGVAIIAVAFYNYFSTIVRRFEDDFQLLKLLFINYADQGSPLHA
ncbi:MAG: MotA/TolQ/ExbB proton channel family protein [Cyanobacteria bacterium HKST-UBA06]|nr:MotA/TolQ/ExbB proton channel family protein [Cyanobacteria bacterium HKST-UBA05]MCA9798360.1 MotA/TolQ/ExbB proton channel family protein [Cyanobacteria bacterium HKST-UBA04]MCA9807178.1 MotA/TolQ/ExbB proton channel family protein [Cyanobacteria bacterium HKST-UBA06]MCA9840588.1 MotA/TolQ/ExbB proton channel family protein [Cyanobacteria bacterium HKST-UBA03]